MGIGRLEGEPGAIEVTIGPYRCGKTSRLLLSIAEHSRAHSFANILVIVPSLRYGHLLEEKLAAMLSAQAGCGEAGRAQGLMGIRIAPFFRACQMVLKACGQPVRVIPEDTRPLVVGRVLAEAADDGQLSTLAPIAGFPGTHTAVLKLIDEFQRSGLSPDEVRDNIERTAADESRYTELAGVYQRYWEALDALGYLDKRRLAFRCRELLFGSRVPGLDFTLIAVDGFDRVSRLQAQIVRGLSRHAQKTMMVFDFARQAGENSPAQEEYLWKESSLEEIKRELEPHVSEVRAAPRPAPVVEMFSALDRYLEMEAIARKAKAAIVEGQVQAGDILVVARDLANYKGAIEAAFERACVPYYVDQSINLTDLPLCRFMRALVGTARDEYPRASMIDLLTSPYVNLAWLGLTHQHVSEIEAASQDLKLVTGRERWEYLAGQKSPQSWQGGLIKLMDRLSAPAGDRNMCFFVAWLESLIDDLFLLPESEADRRAYAAFLAVLRALVQEETILGERQRGLEHFQKRLEGLLDGANFRKPPPSGAHVTICGADQAPNRLFARVFIAGLVEGEFPRRATASGFVSREELARWADFGVVVDNPRDHPGFESALYLSLINRADGGACLSFPRYEMDGEEVVPSFLLTGGKSQADAGVPFAVPFASACARPVSAADFLAGCLWHDRYFEPGTSAGRLSFALPLWNEIVQPLAVARARSLQERATVMNGYLADFVGTGALTVDMPPSWSAKRLNQYGQCPFKYWVTSVLSVEKKEEPEPGLPRAQRGIVIHEILENFYRDLIERGMSLTATEVDVLVGFLDAAVEAGFQHLEKDPRFSGGEFWLYEKRDIRRRLVNFLKREVERAQADQLGFMPAACEASFGDLKEGSLPELVIESEGGPIVIKGQIDRVDFAKEPGSSRKLVRIVDYKTGSTSITINEARDGRNLQMPLYALAAQRAMFSGSRVVEGIYLSTQSGESIGRLDFQSGEAQEVLTITEDHVRRFVDGVRRGDFTVRPSNRLVCTNCEHNKICRIAELAPEEDLDESD